MTTTLTFAGFANVLSTLAISISSRQQAAMEAAAVIVETEAKRVLGTYDYGWPSLSPITLGRKSADTPGLEAGDMRDSITHVATKDEADIGSDDDKALWFELGTSRGQPPRSFLGQALVHKSHEVVAAIGNVALAKIGTAPIAGSTGVLPTPYSSPINLP
jgi:hypothetical protein